MLIAFFINRSPWNADIQVFKLLCNHFFVQSNSNKVIIFDRRIFFFNSQSFLLPIRDFFSDVTYALECNFSQVQNWDTCWPSRTDQLAGKRQSRTGIPGPKSGGRILKHVRYLLKLGLNVEAEFKSKFLNCFGIIFLCNQIAIKS